MMLRRIAFVFLYVSSMLAFAQSKPVHTKVDLVAENTSIESGKKFTLGIRFHMEPGWHIYWFNPGDSGLPPSITWKGSDGFKSTPIQWPVPQRMPDGTLVDYGYTGDTMLLQDFIPPSGISPGSSAALIADVKWLECEKVCVPQKTQVFIQLPFASTPPSANPNLKEVFAKTRTALPLEIPNDWQLHAETLKNTFRLHLLIPSPGAWKTTGQPLFLPLAVSLIENAAPQKAKWNGNELVLDLRISEQYVKPAAILPGVFVVGGKGYTIYPVLHARQATKPN